MFNFGGLFGSRESSSADTITNTQNVNTYRDVGLTGQNAVDALLFLNQTTYEGLKGLSGTVANTYEQGFGFGKYLLDTSASIFNQTTARSAETLANITNAARDVSQRNIASSVGQAVPIQQLEAASASVPVDPKSDTKNYLIIGVVVLGAIFLMKGK